MTEIVFAFNAMSSSADSYLGICRVREGESAFENLREAIEGMTGEEYAYLEQVSLYTDSVEHQGGCRALLAELVKDFYRAYQEADQ